MTSTVNTFLPGCRLVPPIITNVACTSLVVTTTATDVVSAGRATSPSIYSVPSIEIVAPVSFGLFATSKLTSYVCVVVPSAAVTTTTRGLSPGDKRESKSMTRVAFASVGVASTAT